MIKTLLEDLEEVTAPNVISIQDADLLKEGLTLFYDFKGSGLSSYRQEQIKKEREKLRELIKEGKSDTKEADSLRRLISCDISAAIQKKLDKIGDRFLFSEKEARYYARILLEDKDEEIILANTIRQLKTTQAKIDNILSIFNDEIKQKKGGNNGSSSNN